MSTHMGWLQALADVGLSEAELTRAVGESPAVRAEVIRVAEKTRQTWQEVWDEMDHPYQTGAYRDAITIRYEEKPSGEFSAVVANKRPEAHWLEYGTVKMKEQAPARKTIDRMNGEQSGASKGGFTGSVGA